MARNRRDESGVVEIDQPPLDPGTEISASSNAVARKGLLVVYRHPDGRGGVEEEPAMLISQPRTEPDKWNLNVFKLGMMPVARMSIPYSEEPLPRTWGWQDS